VVDAAKVEASISPALYGQFAEFMFENIKGGMHAEMIRNRSFEEGANHIGLSRFWEREPDDRNHDPFVNYRRDDGVSYPETRGFNDATIEHSFRADLTAKDGQRRGLSQGRMPIREGLEYRGHLWLKTTGFDGHVTVALEKDRTEGETYASADIKNIEGDWKKYEFKLTPTKNDPLAKFSILFYGRGRIWVDQVSLMPGDAVDGVRRDVFERIQALRPAFVRWPGGNVAQDYHWMWGVGPRDRRPTWTNLSWWNEPEPSDFGTDEVIRFCRNLGAEPHLVVNVEGRGATADEAAAWVEYANGPATSKYGSMRARYGNPEPFGVKFWEIGNEIWGDWVRGHTDAETYAHRYNRYHAAMRAVDPSIRFIAVGDNDMKWNRTVLKIAGENIDYLAIHHYYGVAEMKGDLRNLMARPLHYGRFYAQVRDLIRELLPGREIKLIINEWNTSLPVPRQHSMESGLYGARLMNVFERSSEIVEMTAVSDLVNGWPGGIIQASRHDVFVTPTYLSNKLYNSRLGSARLATQVEGPTFDSSLEGKGVPYLDVVASRSADSREIYIKLVNTDTDRPMTTEVRLTGTQVTAEAVLETITASSMTAANSFRQPEAVSLKQSSVRAGAAFTVELPKHSISVLTLNVAK
jgi:alpha-N-arabinofuranosidase